MSTPPRPARPISRRGFLVSITGSAVAAAVGARARPAAADPLPGSHFPPADRAALQALAAPAPDTEWGTLRYDQPRITPVDRLFRAQYRPDVTPHLDPDTWRLVIGGLVTPPHSLTLDDLRRLPEQTVQHTLSCISNPPGGALIANLNFTGVSLPALLDLLNINPATSHARLIAADGYSTAVPITVLRQSGALLAWAINGALLTPKLGYPLRVVLPGVYGQKMPRWLTGIDFLDHDFLGYWESRGYSQTASVQTTSHIHTPHNRSTVQVGATVMLQGIAFAGTRRIERVELQIDDGAWFPVTLVYGQSTAAWTQWHTRWQFAAPGSYLIAVRATDETGFTQDVSESASARHGSSAIHRITVNAV